MSATRKWIVLVIFLFEFTTSPILAQKVFKPSSTQVKVKQTISLNQPGVASTFKRIEENAPTLIKLFHAICEVLFAGLWILDTILNGVLWVMNETVSSCAELCVRIFGILFNVVKLLEALGFGVKFLLELNYAVLSYIFDIFGCIRDHFKDGLILVRITIANQTENVYDSSTMALEGIQFLLVSACNKTLVNIRHVSSVVTTCLNNTLPFGLSALDSSLAVSMVLAGLEFFYESLKLTGELLRDGHLFILNCICSTFGTIGACIFTCICFIRDTVTLVSTQIIHAVIWPVYFLAHIVSNISFMLYYSLEAFVNCLGDLDTRIRKIVHSTFKTIGFGTSNFVYTITGWLSSIIYSISGYLSDIVYSIIGAISTLVSGIVGIYEYIPGGVFGCITFISLSIIIYLWHEEIASLLVSSWISLRRMNENHHIDNDQLFHNEQLFEAQEREFPNTQGPSSDKHIPQNQTKLKYELELEKDKRLCVICQDNFKNILLMPCRHVCLCRQCLQQIIEGHIQLAQCPLCRTYIQSTMEVFI
ncbi:uncharacterized protein LOC114533575 [Dendronephthya gigantea]|uniref:uncharacterized protein LOC114533575 n=1 Tax=Dendronephthya gigantea TaxID=151771 RepID=UPI00106D16B2|nr:uncharacterized protein LOC114533575 [Dendronephthya gigantea]